MSLLPVDERLLRLGEPLPVSLWDPNGLLLLPQGASIADEMQRARLMARQPRVRMEDHERIRRPWLLAMEQMVLRNETLGRIAELRPGDFGEPAPEQPGSAAVDSPLDELINGWSSLRQRMGNTLRDPRSADFPSRLMRDADALVERVRKDPDGSLLVLLHEATRDPRDYAIGHGMLVAAIAALVALEHPSVWPAQDAQRLALIGLTMNLCVLNLMDRAALQAESLSAAQRAELRDHGRRSATLLQQCGIDDQAWLPALPLHHEVDLLPSASPVAQMPAELAVRYRARLVRKIDMYAAKLSPRRSRAGLTATQAARSAFLDEGGVADGVGALVIKTLGLYPPGTLVRLRNGEAAIVRSRGARTQAPWACALSSASGLPLHEPLARDTSKEQHAVTEALAPAQLRLAVPIRAVLALKPRGPGAPGSPGGSA